jgi:ATP-dependent DNA helicase RecG
MLKTELIEIIRNGENSAVALKQDTLESHRLAKELVAFANFEGGMVLLGVEDNGTICGISRENLEEWVMNVCRDKIRPEIIRLMKEHNNTSPDLIEDGERFTVILWR